MNDEVEKRRAPRNRTIVLTDPDRTRLRAQLLKPAALSRSPVPSGTINANYEAIVTMFDRPLVDLLILDPPYNLNKVFGAQKFSKREVPDYTEWLDNVVSRLAPLLFPHATVYICGDWHTSASIFDVATRHFTVRNRITWEREKGRGARSNWKNASEDIWYCTVGKDYTFNVDDVKLRRKVIAPYKNDDGTPKDWAETSQGRFRDTHPSNLLTDITIPFWSMPENTDHPTQKSEKLIAQLMLASTNAGEMVFDPFLGSGTTSVVAKKLNRRYLGIELEEEYCLFAEHRLRLAEKDDSIQGYSDGVFWDRNTLVEQHRLARAHGGLTPTVPNRESLKNVQSTLFSGD